MMLVVVTSGAERKENVSSPVGKTTFIFDFSVLSTTDMRSQISRLACVAEPAAGYAIERRTFGFSAVSKVPFPGEAVLVTLPELVECGETDICLNLSTVGGEH